MRQIRFEVQHTRIDNKALAQELQDFTNDCYSVALYLWKQQDRGQTKDKSTLRDIEWIGSSTFQSRYYPSLQSKLPGSIPVGRQRDSGRPNTGRGGYPTCSEWWSSADTGLKARVKDQADPDMWLRISAAMKMSGFNDSDYQRPSFVVWSARKPDGLTDRHVYAGYGGNADFTLDNAAARWLLLRGLSGQSGRVPRRSMRCGRRCQWCRPSC